ncbi:hypothetical protein FNF27_07508 [Cafeteria roenbergensis]|uniref:Uncharacterized protein n=1 Tax=Cafeteria roenbergensis TaxID=33653 RepID=A0A5A8DLR5_CAFRO|nr:hypothetical protein FNF27_07508 [Cafeteria roenbergensis]
MVKIIAGDECGLVKLVRLERETVQKWHVQARKNGVKCLAWTGNPGSLHGAESTVSAALASGIVRTWDMSTMERTHDTEDAPKDAVHLDTLGGRHMFLASEAGTVRVFAKDAASAALESCPWSASAGKNISAAALLPHEGGALAAAGGKDTLLRLWDLSARSASAATGAPIFEARRQHHDWLDRALPVWVSGITFLGARGPTPEGALPPVTQAALDARYESATDDDTDDDEAGQPAAAGAAAAAAAGAKGGVRRRHRGRASAAAAAAAAARTAKWGTTARPFDRAPLQLSDSEDASGGDNDDDDDDDASSDDGAAAAAGCSDEAGLEPWTYDSSLPHPPSRALEALSDAQIKDQCIRRLVSVAPDTRLPLRDADWRPAAGHPSAVVLTVSRHKQVSVYDTRARRQAVIHRERVGDWALTCCAADPLARSVFVGDTVGALSRLEMRKGLRVVQRYHGHAGAIRSVDVHETMPLVASAGLDRCVRVFHAETGCLVRRVYLRQRQEAVLFSRERRVRKPDHHREAESQDDKLGLVVRISSLKGGWRNGAVGEHFSRRPREGQLDEPLEDDGVREEDVAAAGVGSGAAAAGGLYAPAKRSRGEEEADEEEAAEEMWRELDAAGRGEAGSDEEDDDAASNGSDFDDELENDGDEDEEDSLAGDSLDEHSDDDSEGESSDSGDEDGLGRMAKSKDGDDDLALVDDRAALKRARKEAVRGRKQQEKASRIAVLKARTAERAGGSAAAASRRRRR